LAGFSVQFGLTSPFWFTTIAALVLLPFVWPTYSDKVIASARQAAAGNT
jgi:hypothetical protein